MSVGATCPTKIRFFINREDIDLSSASDLTPIQEFDITPDNTGLVYYPTKYHMHGNVRHMAWAPPRTCHVIHVGVCPVFHVLVISVLDMCVAVCVLESINFKIFHPSVYISHQVLGKNKLSSNIWH